jgi:multiple sugar transport system substrate-binding protein
MANAAKTLDRRRFLGTAAKTLAAGPYIILLSGTAQAQKRKTLRIAKWAHFLPEFDQWFSDQLAAQWGKQHDTDVVVDHVPVESINGVAAAEAVARRGHDLIIFPWPPAVYLRQAIDHSEVYQTVAAKFGSLDRFAHRSTFDPKSKRYFAFCDSWIPAPFQFFEDHWAEAANMPLGPVSYDSLRSGGQRIRAKRGVPCGLAMAPTLESNITLHTLLFGFRSRVLGEDGNVSIYNGRTVEALRFAKALYQDAGSPEQLTWGSSGNTIAMLARKTSCTTNAISLLRIAEKQEPEVAKKIMLQTPLVGSAGVRAVAHVTNCSMIWNFAQNPEGARQFLADMVGQSRTIYEKSKGCNFPIFQKTLPDLIVRLSKDPDADPVWKYQTLKDALYWSRHIGYPGYTTPASMDVFNSFIVPKMFLSVVKGELGPGEAALAAETEIKRVVEKWSRA